MSKTILITGGAGFIGHHLCDKLLSRGDFVIIVDNLNSYYDPKIKLKRVEKLKQEFSNLKFYKEDISDFESMRSIFLDNHVDKIVHLAAQAGVRYSIEKPIEFEQNNGVGTINLLELARQFDIKDFIFASSSSVYGNHDECPFSETDVVNSPSSLYAATKIYNELQAKVYSQLFNIRCIGLRFFTVYGPGERPDKALPIFVKNILENKPIDVFNNGQMVRDFTFVDDIVDGTILAIDKSENFKFEIFNLARGETIELIDYVRAIEDALGKKAIINFKPLNQGEVLITNGDISKARNLLGYQPKTSIDEGIKRYVNWLNTLN